MYSISKNQSGAKNPKVLKVLAFLCSLSDQSDDFNIYPCSEAFFLFRKSLCILEDIWSLMLSELKNWEFLKSRIEYVAVLGTLSILEWFICAITYNVINNNKIF